MHLEATTNPHVHQKVEIFWTNIASTMACLNFKNGPKTGLRPLGVNMYQSNSLKLKHIPLYIKFYINLIY